MEDKPTEPTEYCIVHLCDWSMKSHMSIVPLDLPMNNTPERVGLQQPHVLKHPFVTRLVNNGA